MIVPAKPAAHRVHAATETSDAPEPVVMPIGQVSHALVCEPEAEYVPAAQLATDASTVGVQAAVTRWPGPAVEQAAHSADPASSAYSPSSQAAQPAALAEPLFVNVPA